MPIYVYQCKSCGESFEKLVSLAMANETPSCPNCRSKQTEKRLAAVSAVMGKSAGDSGGGCSGGSGKFT